MRLATVKVTRVFDFTHLVDSQAIIPFLRPQFYMLLCMSIRTCTRAHHVCSNRKTKLANYGALGMRISNVIVLWKYVDERIVSELFR